MKLKILVTATVAALVCTASISANAAPLLFDFAGPSGTALFQLDSNPTPDFSSSFLGSDQFRFNNVAGTFDGMAGTASVISFGDGSLFSSFSITEPDLGFTQFSSPTLFTGPPSMPAFSTGTFTLINPFFGNGSLTISDAGTLGSATVPEPATWAMMIAGFGAAVLARGFSRIKVATDIQSA